MRLPDLLDRKNSILSTAERLVAAAKASGKDLQGADLESYNALVATVRDLQQQIDECEPHGAAAHPFQVLVPGQTAAKHETSARSTLRDALRNAPFEQQEQVRALAAYLSGDIRAAADLTPAGDGGFLIPTLVQQTLERNYSGFAPVVGVARVWGTDAGNDAIFPVLSDSESAVQLAPATTTGADATVSGDTPPTDITGPKLGAYKVSSKPVFVPRETISDSPIDIVAEIIGALLARIIRFENLKYTTGSGTGEAEGFMTNCSHHAAGAVALDLDIALDLAYSVPPLYRPNGVFMASDTTIKYLRKLKTGISGDKRSLWKDAFEEGNATLGTPAKLHGYPILVNNDMDTVATDGTFAGKSPLAFGDFRRFVVRQAEMGQGYLYRYTVPARDGSAVIMFRRSDSALLVPEAICKLTVS